MCIYIYTCIHPYILTYIHMHIFSSSVALEVSVFVHFAPSEPGDSKALKKPRPEPRPTLRFAMQDIIVSLYMYYLYIYNMCVHI